MYNSQDLGNHENKVKYGLMATPQVLTISTNLSIEPSILIISEVASLFTQIFSLSTTFL